jgi:hypothetical protein
MNDSRCACSCARSAAFNAKRAAGQYRLLRPLMFAPLLPLIRISLRHHPRARHAAFSAAIASMFAHAAYLAGGLDATE